MMQSIFMCTNMLEADVRYMCASIVHYYCGAWAPQWDSWSEYPIYILNQQHPRDIYHKLWDCKTMALSKSKVRSLSTLLKKNKFYPCCHGKLLHYLQSQSVAGASLIGRASCYHGNVSCTHKCHVSQNCYHWTVRSDHLRNGYQRVTMIFLSCYVPLDMRKEFSKAHPITITISQALY